MQSRRRMGERRFYAGRVSLIFPKRVSVSARSWACSSLPPQAPSQKVDDDKHNVCGKNAERKDGY
jgi:hypothetical protein